MPKKQPLMNRTWGAGGGVWGWGVAGVKCRGEGGGGNILPAMLPVEKSLLHHSLSPCLCFNPTSTHDMMALQLPVGGVSPGSLFFHFFLHCCWCGCILMHCSERNWWQDFKWLPSQTMLHQWMQYCSSLTIQLVCESLCFLFSGFFLLLLLMMLTMIMPMLLPVLLVCLWGGGGGGGADFLNFFCCWWWWLYFVFVFCCWWWW